MHATVPRVGYSRSFRLPLPSLISPAYGLIATVHCSRVRVPFITRYVGEFRHRPRTTSLAPPCSGGDASSMRLCGTDRDGLKSVQRNLSFVGCRYPQHSAHVVNCGPSAATPGYDDRQLRPIRSGARLQANRPYQPGDISKGIAIILLCYSCGALKPESSLCAAPGSHRHVSLESRFTELPIKVATALLLTPTPLCLFSGGKITLKSMPPHINNC